MRTQQYNRAGTSGTLDFRKTAETRRAQRK
jgi:hypothetical protein